MAVEVAGVMVTHNGKTMALSEWAFELGLPYATVRMRWTRGQRDPVQLFAPAQYRRNNVTDMPERKVAGILGDLFPEDVVDHLRDIAKQTNLAPVQVVQKIVAQRVKELLATQTQTS